MKINISIKFCLLVFTLLFSKVSHGQSSAVDKFFEAIRNNNIKEISQTIDTYPGIFDSTQTKSGFMAKSTYYPIHYAIQYGSGEVLDLFLAKGANPQVLKRESSLLWVNSVSCLELLVIHRELDIVKKYAEKLNPSPESYCDALKESSNAKKNEITAYLLSIGEKILIK